MFSNGITPNKQTNKQEREDKEIEKGKAFHQTNKRARKKRQRSRKRKRDCTSRLLCLIPKSVPLRSTFPEDNEPKIMFQIISVNPDVHIYLLRTIKTNLILCCC